MKYIVDGTTTISWSVLVYTDTPEEAEEKAKQYWEHNTTSESVDVNAVYNEETGDLA